MNVTISLDDRLLERAREVARQQGTSVNALIRQFLENLAGTQPGVEAADELLRLMNEHGGRSGGRRILRDEASEGRL